MRSADSVELERTICFKSRNPVLVRKFSPLMKYKSIKKLGKTTGNQPSELFFHRKLPWREYSRQQSPTVEIEYGKKNCEQGIYISIFISKLEKVYSDINQEISPCMSPEAVDEIPAVVCFRLLVKWKVDHFRVSGVINTHSSIYDYLNKQKEKWIRYKKKKKKMRNMKLYQFMTFSATLIMN